MNQLYVAMMMLITLLFVVGMASAQEDGGMIFTPGGNWELPDNCACVCQAGRMKDRVATMAAEFLGTVVKTIFPESV